MKMTLALLSFILISCQHSDHNHENHQHDKPFRYGHGYHQNHRHPANYEKKSKLNDYKDPENILFPSSKDRTEPIADSSKYVSDLRVTILADMVTSRWTKANWGFSAFVEFRNANNQKDSIIFDTGPEPDTVWYNMTKIEKENKKLRAKNGDLPIRDRFCRTEKIFLSHNHQDHIAGLVYLRKKCMEYLLEKGDSAWAEKSLTHVYTGGKEIFWPRIAVNQEGQIIDEDNYMINPFFELKDPPQNGNQQYWRNPDDKLPLLAQRFIDAGGKQFHHHTKPFEISPGIWTTGMTPRISAYDKEIPYHGGSDKYFMRDPRSPANAPKDYLDNVPEDHNLVINTKEGLVVIAGCAHAGIINILNHSKLSVVKGNRPVIGVIGGIHLFPNNQKSLNWIAGELADLEVKYLMGSHCTGIESLVYLRQKVEKKVLKPEYTIGVIGSEFRQQGSSSNFKHKRLNRRPSP